MECGPSASDCVGHFWKHESIGHWCISFLYWALSEIICLKRKPQGWSLQLYWRASARQYISGNVQFTVCIEHLGTSAVLFASAESVMSRTHTHFWLAASERLISCFSLPVVYIRSHRPLFGTANNLFISATRVRQCLEMCFNLTTIASYFLFGRIMAALSR